MRRTELACGGRLPEEYVTRGQLPRDIGQPTEGEEMTKQRDNYPSNQGYFFFAGGCALAAHSHPSASFDRLNEGKRPVALSVANRDC